MRIILVIINIFEKTLEKELSENELRSLFQIIDKQSDISMTDQKGNIVYVNENFIRTSKYSREELIGQNHRMLKSGHQPQEIFEDLWKTISGGRIWRGEVKNRAKDGSYYWSDSIIAPILNNDKKIVRYIAVKLLITERKEIEERLKESSTALNKNKIAMLNLLEDLSNEKKGIEKKVEERTIELAELAKNLSESKKKFEILIRNIGDGVMATNKDGEIFIWNKTAEIITGWRSEDVQGKHFSEVFRVIKERDRSDASGFIYEAMNNGVTKLMENHVLLLTKDNKEIPVGDSASPIVDEYGKVNGIVVVFRDVTKERNLDRAKDEFVSTASHQLRTPLTAIKGYTGMLLDGDPGPLNDKQKEYLSEMKRANNRMIELINSLLNVSRVDLGVLSVSPESLDIGEVYMGVIDEMKVIIKQKKQNFRVTAEEGLPTLNADKKILEMIFQNLLSNAIKYTPEGGNIVMDIKKIDSSLLISVSDTGLGVPEAAKDRIFQKMYRADNARINDPDGTGLGLYIVKAVLDQTGGKIWFESNENKGSTFYVSIPLAGMKAKEGQRGLQ